MNTNDQLIFKIDYYGTKRWTFDGQLHREDGPAVEWFNGDKYWLLNDQLHRLNGPAIEYANGSKEWWYYNEKINCSSQEEFKRLLKLKVLW